MAQQMKTLVEGVDEFIGIDHHKRRSQLMTTNREGKVIQRGNIETSREALKSFLGASDGAVRLIGPMIRGWIN